ncbi:SRPBCC family protein [Mycolicibacterium rufum]|uniref:SRPBCC family protein n=1 Tax=Mycolicibacterium rufum TaxID=318424 RepID=A0A9X2XXB0_9MYCO|nr:SRPBCC family protein [Mycolicibacterium rufum]KGI66270.1 vanillate O-demethylase oxidoreductase VanB [Mycolicibacterium rufum]MCV7070622.1 SRPBCC family protein [Mycolicibacterium rufum]ULP37020.1 SRPBCC family protein [Mycolicibacterium rufum]
MTDRIEKSAVLRAPLDRVWRAISDSAEFGIWFGMTVDAPFVAGTTVTGVMAPTAVDDEVAAQQEAFAGVSFPLHVVALEPQRYFAFRWNPLPEPEFADLTTLVEFTLTEADGGVLLEIVESGFDALPETRRAAAFADNSGGWATQLRLVGRYVAAPQWA